MNTKKSFSLQGLIKNAPLGSTIWAAAADKTATSTVFHAGRRAKTKRFIAVSSSGDEVFRLTRIIMTDEPREQTV